MKIFVTGASGFIGSNFIEIANKKGIDIVGLKRKNSQPRIDLSFEPNWVIGSLDDDFTKELKETDVLVHFASHSPNVPYDSLENCIYWNVLKTLKFFNRALEAGVENFLVAGSSFEYGSSAINYDKIPPDAPLNPIESYPISKALASIALKGWAIKNNVKLIINRIFNVYGEGELSTRLWPSLKKAALNDKNFEMTAGKQIRDFINVKDLSKIFVKDLDFSKLKNGEPLIKNVGSGNALSVLEFSKLWWKKWDAKGNLLVGDISYRKNEVMKYIPKLTDEYKKKSQ